MRLKVLGASAWPTATRRTSGFVVDGELLLDAGTVNSGLDAEELTALRSAVISHAHVDHVKELPFAAQVRLERGAPPLACAAPAEILDILRTHLFNGALWPDFTALGDPPPIRFHPMTPGEAHSLGSFAVRAIPVRHSVPSYGYIVTRGRQGMAYTADMGAGAAFWEAVAANAAVSTVLAECTFPDRLRDLAERTAHLCPSRLHEALDLAMRPLRILVTHTAPGHTEEIGRDFRRLGMRVEFVEQDHTYEV
ncbi:MAG: MBL fold metallo-hydrolase [Deltaproteobacteria bacterium]|nr:MBL fold metallo-hydrolase [Deltaproteobacteria bacterium]